MEMGRSEAVDEMPTPVQASRLLHGAKRLDHRLVAHRVGIAAQLAKSIDAPLEEP
jgi:hypothetical protein